MDSRPATPFLSMIRKLRLSEEILLYGNHLKVTEEDLEGAVLFLKTEFEKEALDFPYDVPAFDHTAAGWAAKTVYVAAQLILYRENDPQDINALLPDYPLEVNASAILSADLCLRFIPDMLHQLKRIDTEDPLVSTLESLLQRWHYSGVSYLQDVDTLDFSIVTSDKCLYALYENRIIYNKKLSLARHHAFRHSIRASLGIYGVQLWKEFTEIID